MKVEEHVPLIQESRKRRCQSSENASKRQQLLPKLPLRLHTSNENVDLSPLVSAIRKAKRIVVVTGAGISCDAGIPDFRSSEGLFSSLRAEYKLNCSGKELFDGSVYRDLKSVNIFHAMIRKLHMLSNNARPTDFHLFLSQLAQESKLLRLYTQNIDFLETRLEGLQTCIPLPQSAPWPTTIPLHGTLEVVSCTRCSFLKKFNPDIFDRNGVTVCPDCKTENEVRRIAGKRSVIEGCLRPRIVLYNEIHPDSESIGSVCSQDLKSRPDCLIVAGTSCKIPGVKRIIKEMSNCVHKQKGNVIWLNYDEPTKDFLNLCDLVVQGDLQIAIRRLKPLLDAPSWKLKSHSAKRTSKQKSSEQTKITSSTKVTKAVGLNTKSNDSSKKDNTSFQLHQVLNSIEIPKVEIKQEVEYATPSPL
ncbi:NAD-dependent protein deacetylase hst4 [Schizosaccharomyces pombe]